MEGICKVIGLPDGFARSEIYTYSYAKEYEIPDTLYPLARFPPSRGSVSRNDQCF